MTRFRWFVLTVFSLAFVMVAFPLQAQEEKAKQGAGRGFGAGRGMGMLDMSSGKLYLLGSQQVQDELKITQEQKDKVAEIQKGMQAEMGALRGGGMQGLSQEERQKRFEEVNKKRQELTAAAEKKLEGILKPEQNKRLGEIAFQQRGVQNLKVKEVVAALKLTEEQNKKIDEAITWGRDEERKLFQQGAGEGEKGARRGGAMSPENREKREKIRQETEAKAVAALTKEQKEQYDKMKGAAFKLDRSTLPAPGFGGGRGGRGGQGGEKAKGKAET